MKLTALLLVSLVVPACALDDVSTADDATSIAKKAKPTTHFTKGPPKAKDPFFTSLGTNGRSCVTCHTEAEGWSITPAGLQARFDATDGLDPVFRTNDGSVSPTADVSTVAARRTAYALMLSKGLVRVGVGVPANAEFTLVAVDDPYGHASAADLSLFRRPLPSTNLRFLSEVMWDSREASLGQQSIDATLGHAQATQTRQTDMDGIVAFETSIYTALIEVDPIDDLSKDADGGPKLLADEDFFIGINDPLGHNPSGEDFTPRAFTLFDAFASAQGKPNPDDQARAKIHRGQELFNSRTFAITGVAGLTDGASPIQGTCSTCHDAPNVGNHSVALPLDIGISDARRRTPEMPLYTLRNNVTGVTVQTTDPGRALITGKWADIGKFKTPVLRGVGLRAPYFHNGIAAGLSNVVGLYNGRFAIGLTTEEKADLVAFLQAL